ncbi:hypothetical protein DES53_102943 [Roseimicrobium gellanilyticum]|uniref:Nucleic acid binding protein n=1 Tax=Roseimicrobium gellanilyticum TaxID=748857 RepID=A0A366HS99_9BACT|nr:hypothetical protein [Roseimicrobium gellanilyticum]RBP46552.1 hypothetical protein DES53_102943 [Roseimicrobium gellanilyticum]
MRRLECLLALLSLVAFLQLGFSQTPQQSTQVTAKKTLENYRDVLEYLPPDMSRNKAAKWTFAQRETVNAALKKALVEAGLNGKFRLKVTQIADWKGMTIYAEVPNNEGYKIRAFGKFSDEWKPKLADLKKGDSITLEGNFSHVAYEDLWNAFSLSISMKDCKFTK